MTSLTDEEISRLIAEKVMCWEYRMVCDTCFNDGKGCHHCDNKGVGGSNDVEWLYGDNTPGDPWSITKPKHSDMIIDKMVEDHGCYIYMIFHHPKEGCGPHWLVGFGDENEVEDKSRHRAIALAALAAKGVEV